MAGYNRIIMMGNLTRDPELRQLQSGGTVCRFGIASNRSFKNRQTGTITQDVCFIDVDVWGAQAESCNQYLQKGRPVLVEGRLKFDSWKDAEGQTRSKYSIVAESVQFLGGASDQVANNDQSEQEDNESSNKQMVMPAKQPTATQASKKSSSEKRTNVVNQKLDEPPFEDDLPF
jgi:single-strand DNA-binding protein